MTLMFVCLFGTLSVFSELFVFLRASLIFRIYKSLKLQSFLTRFLIKIGSGGDFAKRLLSIFRKMIINVLLMSFLPDLLA